MSKDFCREFRFNALYFIQYLEKMFDEKGYEVNDYADTIKDLYSLVNSDSFGLYLEGQIDPYIKTSDSSNYEYYLENMKGYSKDRLLTEKEYREFKRKIYFLDREMLELFKTGMSYLKEDYILEENRLMPEYIRRLVEEENSKGV